MRNFKIFHLERVPGLGFVEKVSFFLKKYQMLVLCGVQKSKKKKIVDETGLDNLKIGNL